MGRISAKGNPNKEYVAIIESTPVCGVAIKKEITEPFDAPSLYNAIAAGTTPQEHNGNGTANIIAYKTDTQLFFDKYFKNSCCGTKTCRIPANKKPSNK